MINLHGEEGGMSKTRDDISPIGRTAAAVVRDHAERDPGFKARWDDTSDAREIARQIIHYRTRTGLSQEDLAARVGTSHSHISRIESGRHKTSVATLRRIGDALGLRLVVTLEPAEPPVFGDATEKIRTAAPIKTLVREKSAALTRRAVR